MANHHPLARSIQAAGTAAAMLLIAGNASAAGFALIEQSVSSMGTAYAGAGSASEDASYVFFNPASMAMLEGSQISNGLHGVLPDSEFKGACTYNPANPAVPAPLKGAPCGTGDGGDGGVDAIVPHFTYVHDINDKWNFGFSVNAPFGLSTKYDKGWAGRYSAVESAITAINLNPTLSFRMNEQASIGFGVSAMYARLELENAIDDAFFTATPAAPDAEGDLDIDDWGFGFNFGVLLEPSDQTRLGLAYRSKVDVKLDGDFKTNSTIPGVISQDAKADVSLPDTLLLSGWHQVTPKTAIMADVMWTQWSKVSELVVKFKSGSSNTFHTEWEDTIRVAIGASYKHSNKLILRTGVAYDESPTPNKDKRLAALPDDDRIWLDFGIGYKHSKNLSFDLGYAHLFIDDPKINSEDADSSAIPGTAGVHLLTGGFDADSDIISAQLNYKF